MGGTHAQVGRRNVSQRLGFLPGQLVQVRQQMMNSMAEEMSYGAMGGYVAHAEDGGHGGGDGGGDAPMRFDRGDSDDER